MPSAVIPYGVATRQCPVGQPVDQRPRPAVPFVLGGPSPQAANTPDRYQPYWLAPYLTQLTCGFNGCTTLPLAACARPGYHEPTSEQQTAGSMWALARDHSVTPGVTSLTAPAPTSGNRWFARPWFPIGVPHCAEHRQAGFCPCTLRRSSDPPEPTFGHPSYLFWGVPPQPNSPPDVVPVHPVSG